VSFFEGPDRAQVSLLPPCIEDYIAPAALVRVVDAFVDSLDRSELGFERTVAAATGRPGFRPGDMLRLYIWGYLNQARSSRMLERACVRDLEAFWLMRRLAPDDRTTSSVLLRKTPPPSRGSRSFRSLPPLPFVTNGPVRSHSKRRSYEMSVQP